MESRTLSAEDLLHGAMYAMEQAGFLLHDAVGLFTQGRYASAVVLAVFSREELGRARIYLENRKRALATGPVPEDTVTDQCDDHVEKLHRGQIGVTLEWGPEHRERFKGLFMHPQSPESKEAHALVHELAKIKARRNPQDTHDKRLKALYVEPDEIGTGWNRPCEMPREECRRLIQDVANSYGVFSGNLMVADEELAAAIAQWSGCPRLPDPIHPDL